MISEENKDLLFKASIFSGLSTEQLSSVLEKAVEVSFLKGDVIMTEGEEGGELFVVIEGKIQIEKHAGEDSTIKIAQSTKRGMMLGEMSLVDMKPRSATVRADSDLKMVSISRESLAGIFDKDPKVLATISLNIARALSDRLRHSNDMLADFIRNFTA
ncbi:MAG: cyclic nucleotide-binding domain-containing protein [Candidatus Marinimicrobia bacterium]|nr:cyclic nucleotide-binding domain-containing protein [Candidatus Neomarinimicrobiota bacterium]